jgi:hypothetical protein
LRGAHFRVFGRNPIVEADDVVLHAGGDQKTDEDDEKSGA